MFPLMHCCRFKQAADQGHTDAMLEVAACYEEGRSVKKNKAEAIRQCKRAAAAGNKRSY
jgi:TPR repeat protein